ncbi:MAG: hypothetical protein M3Y29_00575 [Chloroflexota bacterium]|jgi:hypothetical protein|nr:hypothetical protein [Chloroflexota bacterium]
MRIRTRRAVDEALLRVFVEALADEPFDELADEQREDPTSETLEPGERRDRRGTEGGRRPRVLVEAG